MGKSKPSRNDRHNAQISLLRQAIPQMLPDNIGDLYPLARSIRRAITIVVGPTNSGKSHRAIERLKAAQTGVYLAPLRLLAMEVRDRLISADIATTLLTGELAIIADNATHISSTIECADMERAIEVGVIDEAQMIADRDRGNAWIHAILGLPAKELWIIGGQEALPAILEILQCCNDDIRVIRTARMTELAVAENPVTIKTLPAGSAVIAFSHNAVHGLAHEIRSVRQCEVALIYGALSPEVRLEQARLFSSGEAPILVATDAIGMGLNLPISTIVFSDCAKFDGESRSPLDPTQTRQISGRAGRYGLCEQGVVTAFTTHVLKQIRHSLATPPKPIQGPYPIAISVPIANRIATILETASLSRVLQAWNCEFRLQKPFKTATSSDQMAIARCLGSLNVQLSIATQLKLTYAPAIRRKVIADLFLDGIRAIQNNGSVPCRMSANHSTLSNAEEAMHLLNLYMWLARAFPDNFPDHETAKHVALHCGKTISALLKRQEGRKCRQCKKPLHWSHDHGICNQCYARNLEREWHYY